MQNIEMFAVLIIFAGLVLASILGPTSNDKLPQNEVKEPRPNICPHLGVGLIPGCKKMLRSKHLKIVTKSHIWKPKLLHLHFLHHSWGLRLSMMILIFSNLLLCHSVTTKWIQIRLRQVFVNLSLLSRLCSSAATSLQLGSGANLKSLREFPIQTSLVANQCHKTKTKTKHQVNMLICYMVTCYWGLMCMW